MASTPVRTGAVVVAIAALFGAAAGLQFLRESRYPQTTVEERSMYLTSGATARRLTAGYNALAADLYWIRTIQYYGDLKLKAARAAQPSAADPKAGDRYELLYPLLDLTTSLDPRFNIAYRFGSIFLAEAYPGGAGRPDLAIALLEKGLRDQPDKWEYMQDAGFVHYWWRHDYTAAADWFRRASEVDGSPWFLKSLAATTRAEGGDRRSSRTMWESIRESAEIDWLKSDAERRLRQLDELDRIVVVQQRVDRFIAQTGRVPADWMEMIRVGLIPGEPIDTNQTPYVLEPSGRVTIAPSSPLFPLPDEPRRVGTPGA
jgi:tetratricopeptide (TPR) repeat protein